MSTGPVFSVMVMRMPGPGDGHQAGQDVERVGLLLGLCEGRGLSAGVGLELVAGLLEPVDLRPRPLRGAGQAREDVDEVLLAQPA